MRSVTSTGRLGLLALAVAAGAAALIALGSPGQTSAQSQAPPVNTAPPTISATAPHGGQQLTASPGTWSGTEPIVFTFQWLRCNPGGQNCVEIPGAAQQQYTVQTADVGATLRVRVAATNSAGTAEATSAATSQVAAGPPPGSSIPVTAVNPPERLVPAEVRFNPNPIRPASPIEVRVRVLDTRGFVISGALVFVRSTPLVTTSGAEARTGEDGWATVLLQPRPNWPIVSGQDNLQFFVRARKDGDNLLAGVSGRRLVQVGIAR